MPGGKKGWQSDEERALEAMQRRRDEGVGDDDGEVQTEMDFGGDTKPVDLIDRTRFEQDRDYRRECEIIEARYKHDAAFRALWHRVSRTKRDSESTLKRVADNTLEGASNAQLLERLEAIDKDLHGIKTANGIAKWLIGFVVAATLGSMVVVFTKVFAWGASSGEIEIRLQHLERDYTNHIREHESRRGNWSPAAATQPSKVTP